MVFVVEGWSGRKKIYEVRDEDGDIIRFLRNNLVMKIFYFG